MPNHIIPVRLLIKRIMDPKYGRILPPTFGLPDLTKNIHSDQAISDILSCLLDELKGSQVKELKSILSSKENMDEKKRKVNEILQNLGEYGAYDVIMNMLIHPNASAILLKK